MSLSIRRARPDQAGLIFVAAPRARRLREAARMRSRRPRRHRRRAVRRQSAAVLRDRGMERRARRLCALVLQFLDLQRPPRHLSRGSVRAPGAFAARASARRCCPSCAGCASTNGWSRLQWSVLDWNTPSIDFYKSLGAVMMDEWTLCRVTGPALAAAREGGAVIEIVSIVAVADNGVIGADGAIPWRLKSDHAAPQGDDHGQAGGDGPQDLRLAEAAAARTAPTSWSRAIAIFAQPAPW